MTHHISLEQIDTSGTRRDLLRKSGIAGAGFVAGGVLFNGLLSPAEAASITFSTTKKSAANDVKIANYALTLEYLEAAFYKAAVDGGALKDTDVIEFAKTVAAHEAAHVTALKKTLGKAAVKSPTFDFGNTVKDEMTFLKTAAAIEPVGTSAYAGAGPYIKQLPILKAALSIHSVEANHAAWVASILKYKFSGTDKPSPAAFNPARSEKSVLKIVTGLKFIQS